MLPCACSCTQPRAGVQPHRAAVAPGPTLAACGPAQRPQRTSCSWARQGGSPIAERLCAGLTRRRWRGCQAGHPPDRARRRVAAGGRRQACAAAKRLSPEAAVQAEQPCRRRAAAQPRRACARLPRLGIAVLPAPQGQQVCRLLRLLGAGQAPHAHLQDPGSRQPTRRVFKRAGCRLCGRFGRNIGPPNQYRTIWAAAPGSPSA